MDLKDFLLRNHPGILRKFEEEKEQQQHPKSAPPYLTLPQTSQFNFPSNSPTFSTWKTFPPKEISPASSEDLLAEASNYMSSPVKMIPETQPQSPSQYLFQSRSQSPTMEQVVEMERGNRLCSSPALPQDQLSEASTCISSSEEMIPETQPRSPLQYLSQSRSQSPTMEQVVQMETELQRGNRF